MCVANSARSQVAEGLAKRLFPHAHIESAGSDPGKLNPFAAATLSEFGIDPSKLYSKSVEALPTEFIEKLDYVITLCAEEVCPVIITKGKRLHWPFTDPVTNEVVPDSELLLRFRTLRDSIFLKLKELQKQDKI